MSVPGPSRDGWRTRLKDVRELMNEWKLSRVNGRGG